jgi:hypothetical protein
MRGIALKLGPFKSILGHCDFRILAIVVHDSPGFACFLKDVAF